MAPGSSLPSNGIFNFCRSATVAGDISRGCVDCKKCTAMYPPMIDPTRNHKFHRCFFQSKLKYATRLPRPSIEQIFDRLAENPNVFPENRSIAMISAIAGPETYQG